jgi:anti-sigma factor RsiW
MSRRAERNGERRVELLSAYLDDELSAQERAYVKTRLEADPVWRSELETLRRTVALVQDLPEVAVPRNFILAPSMVRRERPQPARRPRLARAAPVLTAATTLISVLFVAVLAIDLLFVGGTATVSSPEPAAPEIAMEYAAPEEKAADEGPQETVVVQREVEAPEEEAAPPEPPAEEAEAPPLLPEGTPGIGGGGIPPTATLEAMRAITAESLALEVPSPTAPSAALEGEPEATRLPTREPALPQVTEQAPPAPSADETPQAVRTVPWFALEVALGATVVILVGLTILAWRSRRPEGR